MQAPQLTSSPQTLGQPLKQRSPETVDAICGIHGAYEARSIESPFDGVIQAGCTQCAADRQATERNRKAREQAALHERQRTLLVNASGVPARFSESTFDEYQAVEAGQKLVLAICRGFASEWPDNLAAGTSLVFTGGPGTGKTHLAAAIANSVIVRHLSSVAFGTVATFLRRIKSTYAKDSQSSEQRAIDELLRPELLVFDEVGVQVGSEHERLLMFEILNGRYQELRPTILISNLNTDALESLLGQRVMDRYRECGSVLAFDWQSHRGLK